MKIDNDFVEMMKEDLEGRYPDLKIEKQEILKINGSKEALIIRKDMEDSVGIVVYPEDYKIGYEEEKEQIMSFIREQVNTKPELDAFHIDFSKEGLQKHLDLHVINTDKNQELLKKVPHETIHDLSAIAQYRIDDYTTVTINNDLCGRFKCSREEVMEMALQTNREKEYQCESMRDTILALAENKEEREILEEAISEEVPGLYVITDQNHHSGASVLLHGEYLDEISEHLGDFYILPSSQAELIVVMDNGTIDVKELQNIVHEVNNSSALNPRDYLSDNVYYYDGKDHQLSIAEEQNLDKEMDDNFAKMEKEQELEILFE